MRQNIRKFRGTNEIFESQKWDLVEILDKAMVPFSFQQRVLGNSGLIILKRSVEITIDPKISPSAVGRCGSTFRFGIIGQFLVRECH